MSASAEKAAAVAIAADKSEMGQAGMGFDSLPGGTWKDKVQGAIKTIPVLVFGKETCPFTIEVKRTFESLAVPFTLFNVDTFADGAKVHKILKDTTKQTTVPYVYIREELIGGCDATKAAQADGSLFKKLAGVAHPKGLSGAPLDFALPEGSKRPLSTLLYFPEVADDRAARFNAVWGFIISLLVAVFWWTPQAKWTMGGLMIDFLLRFIGGGNISPLGALSNLCVGIMELFGSKPRWVAGQSKQFASLCGFMFAFLSFFFYLVSIHNDKLDKVGLAFTCALGAASFLEGFLGWCMACWMFGLAIQFGILPADTFMVYTNVRDEAAYFYEDANKRLKEREPESIRRAIRADGIPSDIDFKSKAKSDDYTKEDFNIIKHVKVSHFYMHMGTTGLACAWKLAAPYSSLYAPTPVEYAIALYSAFMFTAWVILYGLKYKMYKQKCIKEWQHPVHSNAFSVPFITLILFAYLLQGHTHGFAMALFWIGAPVNMALSLKRMAMWIGYRKDIEHVNPSWMIGPVGNAVAALVGPYLSTSHTDACQFWWAVAIIGYLLVFTLTFAKAVLVKDEDDRARPLLAVWVAAPAVLAVSYLQIYPPVVVAEGTVFNDFIFINLHWIAVAMLLTLLFTFRTAYSGRMRFDMAYWAAGFPSAALSFCCTTYNIVKPGNLSYGIAFAALAFATACNLVLAINTLSAVVRRRVFVPDAKWGPLSFMRLTHEALRGAMVRMTTLSEMMATSDRISPELVKDMAASWSMMALMHEEHSKHEDQVIFKLYEEYYPGITKEYTSQHEHHHDILKTIDELLITLEKAPSQETAQKLVTALTTYGQELEEHLRGEELYLIGMPRKHINLTLQKQTVRKVFEVTPATTWYKMMPWIINNLPMLHQRVRFLKTMLWAMPERAQHFGMMVGLGVDAIQWRRVTDELPEIIPRGAPGYKRYY